MGELENIFGILVSPTNYKIYGIEKSKEKGKILVLNSQLQEAPYLETKIFKDILGEDLGKNDFFLEAKSYGNIIEEYENTLISLLEKEHKIPREYYDKLEEYRNVVYKNIFTLEDYVQNDHRYDEVHEILGGYYVLPMRFPAQRVPYIFNNYYLKMKSFYDNGESLFISVALNYKELGF